MNNLRIGIMGGMGPRATVDFQNRLFSRFSGAEQGIPTVISVNNSSIPDRSSFIVSSTSDPLPELIYSSQILRMAKVDVVCMPCNTAHNPKILSRLMAVAPLPIIDMPAACILVSESLGLKKVLILGTAGTADSRLYNARSLTTDCIYPDGPTQGLISDIISEIKTGGSISSRQSTRLMKFIETVNPDAIILACTELSLLPKSLFSVCKVIDSLDVLVEQCVNISNNLDNMEARR